MLHLMLKELGPGNYQLDPQSQAKQNKHSSRGFKLGKQAVLYLFFLFGDGGG